MYTAEYYFAEIVSAILGISYPFIYQIIARIDDKYHSVNLVRLFRKGMAFRLFNALLIILLAIAVGMPFIIGKPGGDTPFEWLSLQGFSMFVICLTFITLIRLFFIIGRYYDPNDLCDDIDTKLKNRAVDLRHELISLTAREAETSQKMHASEHSQYWISDYEKDCWRATIQKCQERRRVILEKEIPEDLTFKCLTDLLIYSVKNNDASLYIKLNDMLYWCILQANKGEGGE